VRGRTHSRCHLPDGLHDHELFPRWSITFTAIFVSSSASNGALSDGTASRPFYYTQVTGNPPPDRI